MSFSTTDGPVSTKGMDNEFHGTPDQIYRAHLEKIRRVRGEIDEGEYPSPAQLDCALDRMIDCSIRSSSANLPICQGCGNPTATGCGGTRACFVCDTVLDGRIGIAV